MEGRVSAYELEPFTGGVYAFQMRYLEQQPVDYFGVCSTYLRALKSLSSLSSVDFGATATTVSHLPFPVHHAYAALPAYRRPL